MGERQGQAGRGLLALRFHLMRFVDQLHHRFGTLARRLFDAIYSLLSIPLSFFFGIIDKLLLAISPRLSSRRKNMQKRLEHIQPQAAAEDGRENDSFADLTELVREPRRVNRFTTAIVTTGVLVVIGFLSGQIRETNNGDPVVSAVAAVETSTSTPIPTPSSTPTNTPTITPSPSPTSTPSPTPEPTEEPEPTPAVGEVEIAFHDPLRFGGIAFTMRQDGNSDIYVLMVGQDEPIRLTNHPSADRDPAWSPDGRYLAFSSQRENNWDLYVLDLLTGELRRLTTSPGYDGSPSWSPDGLWIVYESYQEQNLDLYLLQADGGGSPVRLTEDEAQDFSPAWSPRGRHIAFTSWRSGNTDIYIMSLNSLSDADAINVSESPDAYEDDPSFSPDGEYLAYGDVSDGYEVIYAKQLENYVPTGPAQSVGQGRHPSWSPDSSSLVYIHQNYDQYYLIASSLDVWNTAPQVYVSEVYLGDSDWSQIALPAELGERLNQSSAAGETPLFSEQVTENADGIPPYLLFEVDVDAPSPYLNDRVDQSFEALRLRVIDEVGWDFLGRVDNMYDALASLPLPGEPADSWNKTGRAFDFYYRYPISFDPQVEIVREERGNETYWRVYLKTALQDGSQGEPLRQRSWDFQARYGEDPHYYDQGGKWKQEPPDGYYVDFTALAEDYGWTRVPGAQNWRTYFQGIRYWHFENRQGLTFDEALLEIFTVDELSMVGGYP
jgi:TolB protein